MQKSIYRYCAQFIAVACTLLNLSSAHANEINIGEEITLFSDLLNEQRTVLIGKPKGYDSSEESYPVIYLLDGGSHFHHVTGITSFLASVREIPEFLVVGIPNTDRNRDLTPPTQNAQESEEFQGSGGADIFLDFISQELIPHIQNNYRTGSYSILIGHSFGGLFAAHALLDRPNTFSGYLLISPSLGWNNEDILLSFEQFLASQDSAALDLYFVKGNESVALLPGFDRIESALNSNSLENLRWKLETLPSESHASVTHNAIYRGLEFIFEDWNIDNPIEIYNQSGITGLVETTEDLGTRFGYERDISEETVLTLFGQLLSSKRFEEAESIVSFYNERYDSQAYLYDVLGEASLREGRDSFAKRSYEKALELEPDNEYYRSLISEIEQLE